MTAVCVVSLMCKVVWVTRHSAVGDAFFDVDAAQFLLKELQEQDGSAAKVLACPICTELISQAVSISKVRWLEAVSLSRRQMARQPTRQEQTGARLRRLQHQCHTH